MTYEAGQDGQRQKGTVLARRIDTRLSVNYNTPQVRWYFRTGSPLKDHQSSQTQALESY